MLTCGKAPFFTKHTNKRFVEKIMIYLVLGTVEQFQEKNGAKNADGSTDKNCIGDSYSSSHASCQ
jgi:hypothetical protein